MKQAIRKPRIKAVVQRIEPPWHPTKISKADAHAVKALFAGNANEHHQRVLVDLLAKVCGGRELEFRSEGERASAFASGKRFVWLELVKLKELPPAFVNTLE